MMYLSDYAIVLICKNIKDALYERIFFTSYCFGLISLGFLEDEEQAEIIATLVETEDDDAAYSELVF